MKENYKANSTRTDENSDNKFSIFNYISKPDAQAETSFNKFEEEIEAEINAYLGEPLLDQLADILEYWKTNRFRFKILGIVVKDLFSVQSSSAAIESKFSESGKLMRPDRRRFTVKTLKYCVFLKGNISYIKIVNSNN